MQIRKQYASFTSKSSPFPNFGKSKMFQHILRPCSLPKIWRALITMTHLQQMVKIKGQIRLPIAKMKPFLIQTVRNGYPTLKNHLGKPSDSFWVMKTSFHDTQMPNINARNSFKKLLVQNILEPVPENENNLPPEKHFLVPRHAVRKSCSTTTKCSFERISKHNQQKKSQHLHPG